MPTDAEFDDFLEGSPSAPPAAPGRSDTELDQFLEGGGAPPAATSAAAPLDKRGMPSMQAVAGTVPQGGEGAASFASKIRAARGLPPAYASGTPEAADATGQMVRHVLGMLATGATGGLTQALGPATRLAAMYAAGAGSSLAAEPFDPTPEGDALSRANTSGLLSGALEGLGLAAQGAAPGAAQAAGRLHDQAGTQWAKAIGGIQRDMNNAGGPEAFSALGNAAKDQGLFRPLDFFPGTGARMAARVKDTLKSSGEAIGKTLKTASEEGVGLSAKELKDALDESVADFKAMPNLNKSRLADVRAVQADIDEMAKPVNGGGAEPRLTAQQLQTVKQNITRLVKNWDPDKTDDAIQGIRRKLGGKIIEGQEEAVASVPGALEPYQQQKAEYGTAKGVARLQHSAARRGGNQLAPLGGLHGTIAAIAGGLGGAAATRDPLDTIATMLLANAGMRAASSPRLWGLGLTGASQAAGALGKASAPGLLGVLQAAGQTGLGLARPEKKKP